MLIAQRIQLIGWIVFLFYYFSAKYFVGGFTGFSVNYLLSVIILVALTAIVPFYLSSWIINRSDGYVKIIASLVAPILLTGLGLSLYFVSFIAPNFANITLPSILHRAIEPGLAITFLMLVPVVASFVFSDGDNDGDTQPDVSRPDAS